MSEGLYERIKEDKEIRELIKRGNANLGVLGFTDHSEIHTILVAERAAGILKKLGYDEHTQEIAKAAGFMHDIGNAINRSRHGEYGGIVANEILRNFNLSIEDRIEIVTCISNHDESTGGAVDPISAALIIADKSDVRRNRVRTKNKADFDIHDRVNYSVTKTKVDIDLKQKEIILHISMDEKSCSMFEYFDIFLGRMQMCRHAAERLGMRFVLMANDSTII